PITPSTEIYNLSLHDALPILILPFWESKFTSLKTLLESGIPPARNKLSGHGAGAEEKEIPQYIVEYALNMTASTILFLVHAEEKDRKSTRLNSSHVKISYAVF